MAKKLFLTKKQSRACRPTNMHWGRMTTENEFDAWLLRELEGVQVGLMRWLMFRDEMV